MRRFTFLLLLLPLGVNAQISLSQANVPAPGDTLSYARDTTVENFDIGMTGPDQLWDFSQLQAEENFQLIATDTAMDANIGNYPGANLIISSDEVKTYVQSSDTAVYIMGGGVPEAAAFGLEVVRFQPPQKLFQFPTTFGTSFTNFYSVRAEVDGALFSNDVDSVRAIRRATATVEVDGYGTVKTPYNNYEALRQRTETVNADSIYVKFFGLWVPFTADTSISVQYQWLAAESKGNLVTAFLDDETGMINSVEFFLDVDNANAPTASFSFEDQGEGTFSFSDQSGNAPSSWQWTFGDGGVSDEQNPVYTYSGAGTYQVCLTATNVIGSNQICQTLTVDLLNAAPNPEHRIQLKVLPNPARDLVLLKPKGLEHSTFEFQLFNSQGKRLITDRFRGQFQIEVSNFPSGIYPYFLRTVNGKKEQWSSGKLQVIH